MLMRSVNPMIGIKQMIDRGTRFLVVKNILQYMILLALIKIFRILNNAGFGQKGFKFL
jgi:hypothetical protein